MRVGGPHKTKYGLRRVFLKCLGLVPLSSTRFKATCGEFSLYAIGSSSVSLLGLLFLSHTVKPQALRRMLPYIIVELNPSNP